MEEIAQAPAVASGLGLEPAMPLDVTNETPSAARMQLYQTQSCLFITMRILVVDFLVHRLQPSQVGVLCFAWERLRRGLALLLHLCVI